MRDGPGELHGSLGKRRLLSHMHGGRLHWGPGAGGYSARSGRA